MRKMFWAGVCLIILIQTYFTIYGTVLANEEVVGGVARHSGDNIDAKFGSTPTIDGTISGGEWSDANTVTFSNSQGIVIVYFKHNSYGLLVAFDIPEPDPLDSGVAFDPNHDGIAGGNDYFLERNTNRYDTRTGLDYGNHDTSPPVGWEANFTQYAINWQVEYNISFGLLSITSGVDKTFGIAFHTLGGSGAQEYDWPTTCNIIDPMTFADISSSDSWSGQTVNNPPTLSSGFVTPITGDTNTEFIYDVTYRDIDNDPPTLKKIFIDEVEYDMSTTDFTYSDGSSYKFSTELTVGDHNFYFIFHDGTVGTRLPLGGTYEGPSVISPNLAPKLISGGIPNNTYSIDEDSGQGNNLIDLETFFEDERDDGNLRFKIVYEENASILDASIDGKFLDVEQKLENWFGTLKFQVKAIDKGLDGLIGGDEDLEGVSNIFNIKINPILDAPRIVKIGPKDVIDGEIVELTGRDAAYEDSWFNFSIVATDGDIEMGASDSLTFESNSSLIKLEADKENPLIVHASLLPENRDVGIMYLQLTVWDSSGVVADDSVDVVLEIKNTNDNPSIDTVIRFGTTYKIYDNQLELSSLSAAFEDNWFNLTVIASDPDIEIGEDDELMFKTNVTLSNFNIDKSTGEVSFLPSQTDVGMLYTQIFVKDSYGQDNDDFLEMKIEVKNTNDPPEIKEIDVETGRSVFFEGEYINITAICVDPDLKYNPKEMLTYKWISNLAGDLGENQTLSTNSLSVGAHNITLTVTDNYGLKAMKAFSITVRQKLAIDIKEPQERDGESAGVSLLVFIGIIGVIIILVIIFVVSLVVRKKKKLKQQVTHTIPPQPQQTTKTYTNVPISPLLPKSKEESELSYPTIPQPPVEKSTETKEEKRDLCPTCGQPLFLFKQTDSYYCSECKDFK